MGRKGWLFVGSDDHGEAAGHIFSLIASARLHRLDPEGYLRDLFRVLAHWPRDRHLDLAPKYWAKTRARLDPTELAAEIGPLTVPCLRESRWRRTDRPGDLEPRSQLESTRRVCAPLTATRQTGSCSGY